ncbi:hypothetical protein HanRHA438_Chr09g0404791 [Helianthus annuus]|nr:hypothetical protein HanRHA438_Chr09g0404791 [Helianthus annuus]
MRYGPKSRTVNNIMGEPKYELTQVYRGARVDDGGFHHGIHLITDGIPRFCPSPAKQLHDTQFPHLSPEGSVVRKRHIHAVISEVSDGDGGRTVGKYVILNLKYLAGHLWGRHRNGVAESHLEMEDATVFLSQLG